MSEDRKKRAKHPENWRRAISITIDPVQYEYITKDCARYMRGKSEWIRLAIDTFITKRKKAEKQRSVASGIDTTDENTSNPEPNAGGADQ